MGTLLWGEHSSAFPRKLFSLPHHLGELKIMRRKKYYIYSLLHHLEEMKIMWSKQYIMLYIMYFVFSLRPPHL